MNGRLTGTSYEDIAEVQYTMDMFERYPCLLSEWKRFRPHIDLAAPEYGVAVDAAIKLRGAT